MEDINDSKEWIEKAINTKYLKYYDYNYFSDFQEIGTGAFSEVHRANYKNLNELNQQYFAIKSFFKSDDATVKAIVHEVTIL
jgi:hypothetical protein